MNTNKKYEQLLTRLGFHNVRAEYNSWNGNMELYADEFKNEQYMGQRIGFYYFTPAMVYSESETIKFCKDLARKYL